MTSTGTSSDTTSNILENGQVPLPLADVDITEERRRRRERNAKDENAHDSILATLILHGLTHSTVLRSKMPRVRRLALIETLQFQQDMHMKQQKQKQQKQQTTDEIIVLDKIILSIVLENLTSSPYISQEQFQQVVLEELKSQLEPASTNNEHDQQVADITNQMAEMVLIGNWDGLLSLFTVLSEAQILATHHHQRPFSGQIAGPSAKTRYHNSRWKKRRARNKRLWRFRTMAVEMLSTSKRIAQMDVDRRRKLGREIHSASSVDEIKAIALRYLDTSSIFVDTFVANNQRRGIKKLVAKGRFDSLLLPEYFDCEEVPRRSREYTYGSVEELDEEESNEDEDECVICLGAIDHSAMTSLPCNHTFCTVCINSWLENSPTCPTCRHPIRHQSVHVSRRFQRQGRPHGDWFHRKLIYTLVVIISSLLLISAWGFFLFLLVVVILIVLLTVSCLINIRNPFLINIRDHLRTMIWYLIRH